MTTTAAEVHDLAAALTIADEATCRWTGMTDHEDLRQVARIAAWRTFDHGHRDRALVYRAARCAAIDELRRLTGHRTSTRDARRTLSIDHVTWVERAGQELDEPLEPSHLYGLTGRHAVIADLVGAGELHQDIATVLGVHPSRVTQLLHEMRRVIEITNRPGGHP